MDALLFTVNAIAPLLLTVVLGYLLKKIGFMTADFAKAANRLVFHVFLPALPLDFCHVYRMLIDSHRTHFPVLDFNHTVSHRCNRLIVRNNHNRGPRSSACILQLL